MSQNPLAKGNLAQLRLERPVGLMFQAGQDQLLGSIAPDLVEAIFSKIVSEDSIAILIGLTPGGKEPTARLVSPTEYLMPVGIQEQQNCYQPESAQPEPPNS